MSTWRLERGPWDGREVEALPGAKLLIPVLTVTGELVDVVYTAERRAPDADVIVAVYEGHIA